MAGTIQAAIAQELLFLRAEAEARMVDTAVIRIRAGRAYDAEAKVEVETYSDLFTTPCRVKVSGGLSAHSARDAGRIITTVTRELHIPVGSPAIPADAVADIESVGATSDPTLLGARLVLDGPAPGSQTTARRLQVSEVLT